MRFYLKNGVKNTQLIILLIVNTFPGTFPEK
jgi:hypothetical protein